MSSRGPLAPRLLPVTDLVLAVAAAAPVRASSWSECRFEVVVRERTASHVRIDAGRFLGSDGSVRPAEDTCRRLIGSAPIPLGSVRTGTGLLIPGARLHARWSRYSAMTPAGAMRADGWSFSPAAPSAARPAAARTCAGTAQG